MGNNIDQKPVIFLCFANDRVDGVAYLRDLPRERRGVSNILDTAGKAGLCEVIVKPDVTIKDIYDVFKDERYRNRIAIFHFAGHANCYQLLLESIEGGLTTAHGEGLASFLGRQNGLKLVFLNGCSSELHSLELILNGIPAVIGTSQAINDGIATQLSLQFYDGIVRGFPIERAWNDAVDFIKTDKGTYDFRNFYRQAKKETEDCFPWNIFYKPGGEKVKDWNLPEAADNPLFGLPEIPESYGVPESPFLFLRRYEREHAKVFFGRSHYIRELYNRISDPGSPGVILLHGQSGVGKSSLLEAGLIPRLEDSYEIIYSRREQEKGLLGTFQTALQDHPLIKNEKQAVENLTIVGKWQFIESKADKPLIAILDQVEEMYTCPNKALLDECGDFLDAVKKIFGSPGHSPKGKLMLCYRKEYNPEIDKKFASYDLSRSWLFLEPLNRRDIMEVVTGLSRTSELRVRYRNIEVEEDLPVVIADDLLEDRNSPISPLLQIIMTRLWNRALAAPPADVRFSVQDYQQLRREGIAMEPFLRQQMRQLRIWYMDKEHNSDMVDKGLALDILKFHTIELGTSCSRKIEEIRQTYPHKKGRIDELVQKLKDLFLLTDTRNREGETCLTHDTLAPVVLKECGNSGMPLQRAERILTGKTETFRRDKKNIYLDEIDLKIVKDGMDWMRVLDSEENELLQKSQREREKRKRARKRRMITAGVLVSLVVAAAVIALCLFAEIRLQEEIALQNQAIRLVLTAKEEAKINPTLALNKAESAYELSDSKNVTEKIHEIYRENIFYKIISGEAPGICGISFSPDGKRILAGPGDGAILSWDFQGKEITGFKGLGPHAMDITSFTFSPDCRYVLTGYDGGVTRLWRLREQGSIKTAEVVCVCKGPDSLVYSTAFSPDGTHILTGSTDRTARLWDLRGNELRVFGETDGHQDEVRVAAFSPDGRHILTGSRDKTAILWDLEGEKLATFIGPEEGIIAAAFSPDGSRILTGSMDGTACLWDVKGTSIKEIKLHEGEIGLITFSPDAGHILAVPRGGKIACLWDLYGDKRWLLKGHDDRITCATFSKDGHYILTAADDRTIRMWDIKGAITRILLKGHQAAVNSVAVSPGNAYILTGSNDKTARLWDFQGRRISTFEGHSHAVKSAVFSPDGRFVITGSWDGSVRQWDINRPDRPMPTMVCRDVYSIAVSPNGTYCITGLFDGTVHLWEFNGKDHPPFPCHEKGVTAVAISSDGQYILTGSYDKTARLWNVDGSPVRVFSGHEKVVTSVAISPNGHQIFTGSLDRTARLWDFYGQSVQTFSGHEGGVTAVAFSSKGHYILTGSNDHTARLWDVSGITLQVFSGHQDAVTSVAFSHDNQKILTGSEDGTVRICEIRLGLKKFLKEGVYEKPPPQKKEI